MNNKDELLTTEQLAKRWSMSESTLRARRSKKQGPQYIKLGGRSSHVLYRLSDVIAYEDSMKVMP